MMNNQFEGPRESWFTRFKNAITGLLLAPIFMIIAFFILREGEAEHAETTFALKKVISKVQSSPEEGKLFFMYDSIYCTKYKLKDTLVSLEIQSNKLFRDVETWQWKEVKNSKHSYNVFASESTTGKYSYQQVWSSILIDSEGFKYKEGHCNPKTRRYSHFKAEQKQLLFGKMLLDRNLSDYILNYEPLDLQKLKIRLHDGMVLDTGTVTYIGNSILYPNSQPVRVLSSGDASISSGSSAIPFSKMSLSEEQVHASFVFCGKGKPQAPFIGDARIIYWHIPAACYSIIAQKQGNKMTAQKNDSLFVRGQIARSGSIHSQLGSFGILFPGRYSKEDIFKEVHDENNIMFVSLRFAGLMFMVGGFALFGSPVGVVLSWIPFFGFIWEKLIYKIMMTLGVLVSIVISVFYFLKFNSLANLSIYDLYFAGTVLAFLLFTNSLRVSIGNYSQDI